MALSEREKGTKLTEALVLARTRATDLESVRKLNCWASQIGDASIVRRMPNLEVCSLSVNNLTSLVDFAHCPNLQELYIRKNRVDQLSDVLHLRRLERLRFLWLSDNPCSQGDNYRMTVLRTLPNLHKLDNIEVTEEEINRALEEGDDLTQQFGETGTPDSDLDPVPVPHTDLDLHTDPNTNAVPSITKTSPDTSSKTATTTTTTTTTTPNCYGTSIDTSSDNADEKEEEEEDSGVEVSAAPFHPRPSQHGPCVGVMATDVHRNRVQQEEGVKLSWEETNQIRTQLGLKPLPMSKVTPHKSVSTGATKARNANILQSVLLLVRELDRDSLETIHSAVQNRLENM
ncbi:uncharacterized protein LOC143276472 [Babylonia areolata]|uniref:uncharacterized protein LOC143276472 n=1 Tax=Babylonia areolata TaxID=304850 RepID=UPI003FD4466D